jgi:riboflavin synthase alpha subunit
MFTGIVSDRGRVASARRAQGVLRLAIDAPATARRLGKGDSVAVAGVCQTVVRHDAERFVVEAVPETVKVTTLGALAAGSQVNLELPLACGDALGGHLVSGHVDAVATVRSLRRHPGGATLTLTIPAKLTPFVVDKGSIAVDGVSLTVVSRRRSEVTIAIIPHTLASTTLGQLRAGGRVNIEVDLVARYVHGILEGRKAMR